MYVPASVLPYPSSTLTLSPGLGPGTITVPVHPPEELVLTVLLEIEDNPNLIVGDEFATRLLNDTKTEVPLGPDAGTGSLMNGTVTVNGVVGLLEPSLACIGCDPDGIPPGIVNFTPLKPPVMLDVTVDGVVVTDVPSLMVNVITWFALK